MGTQVILLVPPQPLLLLLAQVISMSFFQLHFPTYKATQLIDWMSLFLLLIAGPNTATTTATTATTANAVTAGLEPAKMMRRRLSVVPSNLQSKTCVTCFRKFVSTEEDVCDKCRRLFL